MTIETVYGCVTNGELWKFLTLQEAIAILTRIGTSAADPTRGNSPGVDEVMALDSGKSMPRVKLRASKCVG